MTRVLSFLILITWLCSCENSEEAQRIVDAHYAAIGDTDFIENIITKATGESPDGDYYTITKSSLNDDYLLFLQDYDFKSSFNAVIFDWKNGQGLDTSLVKQGALSTAVIAVLKAHEFHELVFQPEERFNKMTIIEDTTFFGQKCHQVITSDHLGLPVRVFFDKQTSLMAGFSEVNPYKKGEVIKVHFGNWKTQDDLKLFYNVTIEQGQKSVYKLQYESIIFNDPTFSKLSTK